MWLICVLTLLFEPKLCLSQQNIVKEFTACVNPIYFLFDAYTIAKVITFSPKYNILLCFSLYELWIQLMSSGICQDFDDKFPVYIACIKGKTGEAAKTLIRP